MSRLIPVTEKPRLVPKEGGGWMCVALVRNGFWRQLGSRVFHGRTPAEAYQLFKAEGWWR